MLYFFALGLPERYADPPLAARAGTRDEAGAAGVTAIASGSEHGPVPVEAVEEEERKSPAPCVVRGHHNRHHTTAAPTDCTADTAEAVISISISAVAAAALPPPPLPPTACGHSSWNLDF